MRIRELTGRIFCCSPKRGQRVLQTWALNSHEIKAYRFLILSKGLKH